MILIKRHLVDKIKLKGFEMDLISFFTYPCVHEYKIHLAKCEDHLKDGVDPSEDLVAG